MPVAAQTTVTSNGREGPTACLDQGEVDALSFSITALNTATVSYTTPPITWNQYVGRLGDTTPPLKANIYVGVYNAGTKVILGRAFLGDISTTRNISAHNTPLARGGLSAKTVYYLEVYADPIGSIPKQVFARRCFMTGGTYTMTVAPGTQGKSSGCFSISEQTGYNWSSAQHVRNCMCGRGNTLPRFRSTQDNTAFLNALGCR